MDNPHILSRSADDGVGALGLSHDGPAISVASPSPVATTIAGGLPLTSGCCAISHGTCRSTMHCANRADIIFRERTRD